MNNRWFFHETSSYCLHLALKVKQLRAHVSFFFFFFKYNSSFFFNPSLFDCSIVHTMRIRKNLLLFFILKSSIQLTQQHIVLCYRNALIKCQYEKYQLIIANAHCVDSNHQKASHCNFIRDFQSKTFPLFMVIICFLIKS